MTSRGLSGFSAHSATLLMLQGCFALPAAAAGPTVSGHGHLTPLAMFLGADIVVKVIMIGLATASVTTWTIAIGKILEIGSARRRVAAGAAELARFRSLTEAHQNGQALAHLPAQFQREALAELALTQPASDRSSVEGRIASRLADIEEEAARRIRSGTGILATIGSTAPFVGLLGTVWGIMNSFIGIAASNTTNLAVVAPGIAEALLATAFGLVAAIPAVVVYNVLARKISRYRAHVRSCSAEVQRLASRDLDRTIAVHPKLHLVGE